MKYSILFWFILWFCINILNNSFDLVINTTKYNLFIGVVLIMILFFQTIFYFLKQLTKMVLVTTVDFNLLEGKQVEQDALLPAINAVSAELKAALQPALDDVTSTQAQLAIDQAAAVAAQAVLDAANATVVVSQVAAQAAIDLYNFKAIDSVAWDAYLADQSDDAANIANAKAIYLRNGGV